MKNRNLTHSDNWATPKDLYEKLDAEFCFDFDPCPLNEEEITPESDGLLVDWGERNFVNPPYSRKLKEAFVRRAIALKGEGKSSVMLLPVSTAQSYSMTTYCQMLTTSDSYEAGLNLRESIRSERE